MTAPLNTHALKERIVPEGLLESRPPIYRRYWVLELGFMKLNEQSGDLFARAFSESSAEYASAVLVTDETIHNSRP
jgi:hypothetical protein